MNRKSRRSSRSQKSVSQPVSVEQQWQTAVGKHQQGRYAEAIEGYRRILTMGTDLPEVHLNLAGAFEALGHLSEAEAHYRRRLVLQPDCLQACFRLGRIYERTGESDLAIQSYFQALAIRTDFVDAHLALGLLFFRRGELPRSMSCYQQALALDPNQVQVHFWLGCVYQQQGRLEQAIDCYERAIALNPAHVEALTNLGLIYKILNQREQAVTLYTRALAQDPQYVQAMVNLGFVYESDGDLDGAEVWFHRALVVQPAYSEGIAGLAAVKEKRGHFQEAYLLLKPLLEGTAPVGAAIHFATVCLRLGRSIEAMPIVRRAMEDREVTANEYALLLFKLGDLAESVRNFDEAFEHYRQANYLSTPPFEPEHWIAELDRLIGVFQGETLARLPRVHSRSELPIFIVGMPRSGTSLVEQILASHPEVYGGGELPSLFECVAALELPEGTEYPEGLSGLSVEYLEEVSRNYRARFAGLAPEAKRITDKMPLNYLHLGLVALAFPGARIVHCLRDPLDTCLSCYFQNFGIRQPYAGDLHNLGIVYRQHERLMDHWKAVLDLEILTVRYEELVADAETVSRKLLDFVGIEWHPDCLQFHRTPRTVNTASYDQIRRPIYHNSVGRARRDYARHLGPLIEALTQ